MSQFRWEQYENFTAREIAGNCYSYEITVDDYYSGAKVSGPEADDLIDSLLEESPNLEHKLLRSPITNDVEHYEYAVWFR